MTDFRALCAELVNDLEEYGEAVVDAGVGWVDPDTRELLIRARALLAQPEPKGPTDDKLMDIARATDLVYYMGEGRGFASPYMEETDITAEVLAYARAALAKWGHQ